MPRPPTLNQLSHLQESGFGWPWPHHGLKLLYWFAKNYIKFDEDNEMCWRYDPNTRFYGFHPFENRYDGNVQLLPDTDFHYYEVGNLHKPNAHRLPEYVRKDYTEFHDESNTDRIIVSVDDEDYIDRVYITEHLGESDYNPDRTFRISRGLIKEIQKYRLKDFLKKMDF